MADRYLTKSLPTWLILVCTPICLALWIVILPLVLVLWLLKFTFRGGYVRRGLDCVWYYALGPMWKWTGGLLDGDW